MSVIDDLHEQAAKMEELLGRLRSMGGLEAAAFTEIRRRGHQMSELREQRDKAIAERDVAVKEAYRLIEELTEAEAQVRQMQRKELASESGLTERVHRQVMAEQQRRLDRLADTDRGIATWFAEGAPERPMPFVHPSDEIRDALTAAGYPNRVLRTRWHPMHPDRLLIEVDPERVGEAL